MLRMLWFGRVAPMLEGRLLIALLALSAPPSDCFFAPGSPPCRDLCSTLQDCSLISSSPFLSLLSHPRHCWMACLGSFSAPRHTWRQPTKSSRKAWSSTQQALTSFVSQSSCSAFAGRIPWLHFIGQSSCGPPYPYLAGPVKAREGPFPSCPGLGNGLVDSTSFGSLCPIRSVWRWKHNSRLQMETLRTSSLCPLHPLVTQAVWPMQINNNSPTNGDIFNIQCRFYDGANFSSHPLKLLHYSRPTPLFAWGYKG